MKYFLYTCLFLYAATVAAQDVYSPKYVGLKLSNDVIDKTDYYYSNGIGLIVNHNVFRKNPFNKLIPSLPKSTDKVYGLYIMQDMYTPEDVKDTMYIDSDRPYVGNLMLYMNKISFLTEKRMSLFSSLGLGFIGEVALAGHAQDWFHELLNNNVSTGWHNQLDNKLLLNYSFVFQKGLHVDKNNQFIAVAEAEVGNLRTNTAAGYIWRFGMLSPYFQSYSYVKGAKKFFVSVFIDMRFKFVLYDATLKVSDNELNNPAYSLNPFIVHSRTGLTLMYKRYNVVFVQNFLSPEFSTGLMHRYASLDLGYRF